MSIANLDPDRDVFVIDVYDENDDHVDEYEVYADTLSLMDDNDDPLEHQLRLYLDIDAVDLEEEDSDEPRDRSEWDYRLDYIRFDEDVIFGDAFDGMELEDAIMTYKLIESLEGWDYTKFLVLCLSGTPSNAMYVLADAELDNYHLMDWDDAAELAAEDVREYLMTSDGREQFFRYIDDSDIEYLVTTDFERDYEGPDDDELERAAAWFGDTYTPRNRDVDDYGSLTEEALARKVQEFKEYGNMERLVDDFKYDEYTQNYIETSEYDEVFMNGRYYYIREM